MGNQKLEKDGVTIEFNVDEFQENRPDFKPLDAPATLELLKESPKSKKVPIKLEKGIEFLVEKETGMLFKIVMGKVPTLKERKKRDITASMLTIEPANGGEQRMIMLAYSLDGQYSEANKFEVFQGDGKDA